MNSSFMGLEIGRRGLMSHQQALHVTGHNISNAENREYSRQRVVISSSDPLYLPALNRAETPGNIGQGAHVAIVERIRNLFIDDRIVAETEVAGYWETRNELVRQIEQIYNEPSADSLRSRMDELWRSWEELSRYPEQRATREVVKEKAINLAGEVRNLFRQLNDLRNNVNNQVQGRVNEINSIGQNIRDLNVRILKSEALGDNPNDLRDRRDALVEQLSRLVNISVGRSDHDETIVYIGGENFIQGEIFRPLEARPDENNHGFFRVVWQQTGTDIALEGGVLKGLIEMRDVVLRENINDINSFALNLTDLTNEVHRDGFGRRGETNISFFSHLPISGDNVDGNHDLNNDGVADVSAIFRVSGANRINASAPIGITGTITMMTNDGLDMPVQVSYNANDTMLSVIRKINDARTGVVAYLNHNGSLAVKATVARDDDRRNFMIRYLEDSGQFLVGLTGILRESGAAGSFDYRRVNDIMKFMPDRDHISITPQYNPAANMAVSNAVSGDVDRIAAAMGTDVGGTGDFNTSNGVGDGSNALRLARLRQQNAMIDNNTTFNEFYNGLIARIGTQGQQAQDRVRNQTTLLTNLTNLRESVSGINLDEEMSNMVMFQHGYNASARVISMFDKMLETIIGLGA